MSEELKNEEKNNNKKNNKKKNKAKGLKITLLVLGALLVVLITGSVIYINDYYHASDEALQALSDPPEDVSIMMGSASGSGDIIVYEPENATTGLIFYPGAKVSYEAYAPLMKACSEKGILCIIVKMPGNLAMLGINGADGLQEAYPHIEHWYIGGHSLGGAVASMYAYDHPDEYEGVILLAAYSTKDLGASNLNVLSIYGSEDEVLNKANYEKYKENLGDDYEEIVIKGGCHAYFGCYGAQKGDGNPTILREEQIKETVNAISDFVDLIDEL